MALSIFVFVFFGLMTGLLVYFPLRRATTKVTLRPVLLFFVFIGAVFLGNGFIAFLAARGLWAARTMPPVTSIGAFGDIADGDAVIIEGTVSIDNPMILRSYVAYTGCDEETCNLRHVPTGLQIAVDDGNVTIANDDFEAADWPAANNPPEEMYSATFLASGEQVVVAGNKEAGTAMRADVVYAGSHAAFVARAGRRLVAPAAMLVLNLLGLIVVIVLPVRRYRDIARERGDHGV